MNEEMKIRNLINQYSKKIENIHKRNSTNQRGIDRFKRELFSYPVNMNIKVIRNQFEINNDNLRLGVYNKALDDLEGNQYSPEEIRKAVANATAQINREIPPRKRDLNKSINNYRRNNKKRFDYFMCSFCGIEINDNDILCEDCAEAIGVLDLATYYCEQCGKIVPGTAKFCPGYGEPI